MRDFTFELYNRLLHELRHNQYTFQTFEEFITQPAERVVVLRHDVDTRNRNSLQFALIEYALDIRSTFFFRILPQSYDPVIVDLIINMGHELGYHYEDLSLAQGDMQLAIDLFVNNLTELRKHYPVRSISSHKSLFSKYDNRDLWTQFNYHTYGIVGEPRCDVSVDEILYLTDTGSRWDGQKVSVRDKVNTSYSISFSSTHDIIKNIKDLPNHVMFNFHPQRWNDQLIPWVSELILQNIKNKIKKYFFMKKGSIEEL
jgi:hypothetical protein